MKYLLSLATVLSFYSFAATNSSAQVTTGKYDFQVVQTGDPISQVCLDFIEFSFCDSVSCRSYTLSELINLGTFSAYDGQRTADSDLDPFWEIYHPGGSGVLPSISNGGQQIDLVRNYDSSTGVHSYTACIIFCCEGREYQVCVIISFDDALPQQSSFTIDTEDLGNCE